MKKLLLVFVVFIGFSNIFAAQNKNYRNVYRAAKKNDIATLKAILDENTINEQDAKGRTMLHVAAECNNKEFVKILLEAGANPNIKDKHGNTPLHVVCMHGMRKSSSFWDCRKIILLLLLAGAHANVQNKAGNTPLHVLVKHYFKENSYLYQTNKLGKTSQYKITDQQFKADIVLRWPRYNSFVSNINDLLSFGASPQTKNNTGQNPFDLIPENKKQKLFADLFVQHRMQDPAVAA